MRRIVPPVTLCAGLMLTGCGDSARQSVAAGQGLHPDLPAEVHDWLPTMKIPKVVGWTGGLTPIAAPGLKVNAFAGDLDHPRWLAVLPDGDVLVAETNAPPKPDDGHGIRGIVERWAVKRAGGASPSPDRITLLRDTSGDGVADQRTTFLRGLHSPFGMALVGDTLYVADTDALLAFPYHTGDTEITASPRKVTDLPAGTINHHWTKNVIASPDGRKLYVTIGSNSNIGENGMAAEKDRAQIWEVDPKTGAHTVYAAGLRNPNGMAWTPDHRLWTAVNERDGLGSDLVPDFLTSVQPGGFYGWPWRYWGNRVDRRVKAPPSDLVAQTLTPDYALGAHTASLGLVWSAGETLGPAYASGMFVGQHGSWNRRPPSGYRVVFVPFAGDRPSGAKPVDVLAGFLSPDGDRAHGRPVGVAIAKDGSLLVADDGGNMVWRVAGTRPAAAIAQPAASPAR